MLEASLADQARGGQGNFTGYGCLAFGMPLMMNAFYPLEFVITPDTTYILINHMDHVRRIFTDGRELAEGDRAQLPGLLHRQVARCGQRRPL